MKTYLVSGTMTVSCHLSVKAEDIAQALELARVQPNFAWDVEKDGEPENLQAEDEQ